MKKSYLLLALAFVLSATASFAQRRGRTSSGASYNTALGLGLDFGNGATLVGPSIKHFFDANNVGQADLLFGGGGTYLGAYYQYHAPIANAPGLKWYVGLGPQLGFGNGDTDFYIRPMLGLDYKFTPDVPLSLAFDWRPSWYISDNDYYGNQFEAGRFGLGFRFTF
ncbi:hypothetical protein KHS38_09540 [Mucilaginibacter sp. Bleaf8]|uniref:hypothetical protein n=1 Tax=Mucilaginibacter sp. Bleaf8 TaxID=2834430 RepID=UPI001BCF2268|nr:hypothetical protein [Mucilaginibacter sp. Bleaf8]MBS7564649.1 hypothetical protein [Mucilaginibacter sp. Bleaf8]